MTNTTDSTTKLPRSVVNLTLVATFAPVALMLMGVDLSSMTPKLSLDVLRGLGDSPLVDVINNSLRGSYTHTLLEWSAISVALFTAGLAFAHYRIVRDVTTPLIAMALLASGAMDAFHTLAADRVIEAVADNRSFLPFTWALSRVFYALVLMIGVGLLLGRKRERFEVGSSSSFLTFTSLGFLSLAYVVIRYSASSANLPQTQFPDSFITRPWDLAPLLLLLVSGIFLYPRFYRHNKSVFAHALIIGAIPAIMAQVHMAFGSSFLFDSNFNAAHYLKVVSYLAPLAGLLFDYLNTYKVKERVALQLEDEILERRTSQEKLTRVSKKLRESEAENAQRAAYLQSVFNSSNTGMILTTDTEGFVILISAGSENLLGYSADEICAKKKIIDFIESKNEIEGDRWIALTALARTGLTDRNERMIVSRTGERIPVDLSISAVFRDDGGDSELEGFLLYGIDIREAKEREELVRSASESAAKAQAEAFHMAEESESRRRQLEEAMAQVELAEMELRVSQKRIEEVTSTIDEAIWSMDAETQTFTYLSEACEKIFGFLPGDYLNRPELLENAIYVDDKLTYLENLDRLGHGQHTNFEFRITDANGTFKWVKALASPIEFVGDKATRFTGSFSDITELHEATDALQESEAKVRAILENVVDGIITLDSSGRIQMSNPAMSFLFGFTSDEFLNKHITEIVSSEKQGCLDIDTPDFMRKTLEKQVADTEDNCALTATDKDGRKFPIEMAFSEFQFSDNRFYIAVLRDITARIAQQEFLAQAEKNTAIGALAAGVAHEFKNCLGGIMGNATLALDYPAETKLVTESLETIVEISDKANRIALSLLSYAQTGDTASAETETSRAYTVVQEVDVLLENECREQGVRLRIDVDEELFVAIDPTNLQQVIVSIARNSVQASETGSIVQIRGFREKDYGIIEIRDSGCGMDEEVVKRAFDPFFSSKGVWGDDATVGQGLGLTTAKNMIEKSGGSIELRSRKDNGTTVEIRLPLGLSEELREEEVLYGSSNELPGVLVHQFVASSLSDVEVYLKDLQVNWKPVSCGKDLAELLGADVGIVFLDGMVPSKIDFAQMFESIRKSQPDTRIVVVVDSVYDYYIADYVKSADYTLQRPISISCICQALSLASPAHGVSSASVSITK